MDVLNLKFDSTGSQSFVSLAVHLCHEINALPILETDLTWRSELLNALRLLFFEFFYILFVSGLGYKRSGPRTRNFSRCCVLNFLMAPILLRYFSGNIVPLIGRPTFLFANRLITATAH